MTEIAQKLRKEADLNRKVEAMDSRLSDVEKSMAKILANQETQTALLQQLVAAQLPSTQQLDANKKGEKGSSSEGEKQLNIQVSKVIMPTIAFTKPPAMDNIDIINMGAAKLNKDDKLLKIDVAIVEMELKEKWRKIDAYIQQKFGPIQKPDKTFIHHSQVKNISVNEMSMNYLEKRINILYQISKGKSYHEA